MEQQFLEYISTLTSLSKEEEEALLKDLVIKQFEKGEAILREGEFTQNSFLILAGCIRRHRLIEGLDKTTGFFTEGEVVAEFESLSANKPSSHTYSCVEASSVVVVDAEKEKAFYEIFPRFEEVSRIEMEKMIGKNQADLSHFITQSPEERYKHLVRTKPDLIQRVPQHQIASYLGVTPESLSRIKKRIMK